MKNRGNEVGFTCLVLPARADVPDRTGDGGLAPRALEDDESGPLGLFLGDTTVERPDERCVVNGGDGLRMPVMSCAGPSRKETFAG